METGLNIFWKQINFSWPPLYLQALPVFLLSASHRADPQKLEVCLTLTNGCMLFTPGKKWGGGGGMKVKGKQQQKKRGWAEEGSGGGIQELALSIPSGAMAKLTVIIIALLSVCCAKSVHGLLTWSSIRPLRSVI